MSGLKQVRQRWGDALTETPWDEFEKILADYYRGQGYRVEHVGTGVPGRLFDGGIDLKLWKGEIYTIVQCKHWNVMQVPHNDVHQLLGVMMTAGAEHAILVTSGEFTPYAREAAAKVGSIELVDGAELRQRLGPLMPEPRPVVAPVVVAAAERYTGLLAAAVVDRIAPRARRSRAVDVGLGLIAAKLLAFMLFAVLVLLVFPPLLDRIVRTAVAMPTQTQTAARVAVPVADPQSAVLAERVPVSRFGLSAYQPPVRPRNGKPAPVIEIGSPDEMMPARELAEWKRNNAESMRVLEARVPELQH